MYNLFIELSFDAYRGIDPLLDRSCCNIPIYSTSSNSSSIAIIPLNEACHCQSEGW